VQYPVSVLVVHFLVTPGSTFNGNVSLSFTGGGSTLTMDVSNITINGSLVITSTASGNIFSVPANTTLTILGDLGDPANNNLSYSLGDGAVLIVTGSVYGKNSNTITGTGGTISAGNLNFTPGDLNCTSGCPW